jgi:hypothetical protein
MFKSTHAWLIRSREIDRGLGKYAERLSRFIWPWGERWLLVVAGSLCLLDFATTYILLGLSGREDVYESGFLASRALEKGGFPVLITVDLLALAVLSLLAFAVSHFYVRKKLYDYGRAAFVFILIPYIVVTAFVIINTIIMLFS